jgi:uncharacterized paraquat-inducible protein A
MTEEQPQYPSLIQQAKNLAQFTSDVVNDPNKVDDAVYEQRLDVCKSCNFYDVEQNRCMRCGCWLKYKARYSAGQCPIGKW